MSKEHSLLPTIDLTRTNGNSFAILGAAERAIKMHYTEPEKSTILAEFNTEAKSGDYDHLIQTVFKYCNVTMEG